MKIVLAYSGGLDTSVILAWLAETYRAEVVAVCADVGQGDSMAALRRKALRTGASRCQVIDVVEEFTRDFVYPMMRAGALYEGQYLMGTSIARPLIAQVQVRVARQEGADTLAHGATGKGNDQVRFELAYAALAPDLNVIAPWRQWSFRGRADLIAYARAHGIPVPVTRARPYSTDRNLLHISFESGVLEDPWRAPPEAMFKLTVAPEQAPDRAEIIELEFERGDAVGLKVGRGPTRRLTPARMLAALNRLGGRHGVGRVDMVENRFVGIKSRGVYETPGGTILHYARRQVESITMDREVMRLRDELAPRYAALVYNGFWFSPEREALQTLIDETERDVTGVARLKLYKGNVITLGRRSRVSLYQAAVASMEDDAGAYDPADATGFIRLQGLRLRTRSILGRKPVRGRSGSRARR